MLDDHQRVAQVAQLLERGDELAVVALVQADARLVEDIEYAHERGAYLRGQPYALALAAGEGGRRAGEGEILQANALEEVQPRAYLLDYQIRYHALSRAEPAGQGLDELQGLGNRHVAEIHDGQPAHGDGQGLFFQALAAAVRAGVLAHILLVLLAHALALCVPVAALDVVYQTLKGLLEHALAARGIVLQLERLAVRAVHDDVQGLLGQVLDRRCQLEVVFLREGVIVHLGDAVALGVAPAGGLYAALQDGKAGVADDEPRVGAQLSAQPRAGRAGTVGAVEGEHARRELLNGDAAVLAGVVLGEELLLSAGRVVYQHQTAGEAGRRLRAVREAAGAVGPHDKAVHDNFYVVLFILVEADLLAQVVHRAVHAHAHIAGLARVLEHLGVLALARAHDRREDLDARTLRPGEDLVDDLVYGLLADLLTALGAVRYAYARPEQAQIVVDLRHRAHGGARVAAGGLLVNAYGRGEALDVVNVGLVHLPEEHARVAGQALHVAPLALCVYRVERERALAGAGKAGEHDKFVARNLQVDVLEVVLPRALDVNAVSHVSDSYLLPSMSQSGNYTAPGGGFQP